MKAIIHILLVTIIACSMIFAQAHIWQEASGGLSVGSISAIKMNPSGYIFAYGYANPFFALSRSSDEGSSWNKIDNIFPVINFEMSNKGDLFVGGPGSALYRSTDNGNTWSLLTNFRFSEAPSKFLSFDNPKLLFVQRYYQTRTTGPSQLYFSSNNGDTWNNAINFGGLFFDFTDIQLNSVALMSDSIVFVSTVSNVYLSLNNAKTFNYLPSTPKVSIRSLCSPPGISDIYILSNTGLLCSSDTGKTWVEKETGLSTKNVLSLTENSKGELFVGTDSGLFISINNGNLWSNIGLQHLTVNSILFIDSSAIVATTNEGIFFSINRGETWVDMNSGLPAIGVNFLTLNSNGHAFVVCNNKVFKTFKKVSQITSVGKNTITVESFGLQQNYPNPFNLSTIIVYTLKQKDYVRLVIYDILGNKVQTLVDQIQQQGSYQVAFDGTNLSSGIYFCRIQTSHLGANIKMILTK